MASDSAETNQLFVLKVALEHGTRPLVRWELEQADDGTNGGTPVSWRADAASFGLPERIDTLEDQAELHFVLPEGMLDEIERRSREREDPAAPLWVHLVEPYGYLGIVPWERLLGARVDGPVLRLPRFVVDRHGPGVGLDVVICGALPAERPTNPLRGARKATAGAVRRVSRRPPRAPIWPSATAVADRIATLAEAICTGSPRSGTRVYCLVTSRLYGPLTKALKGRSLGTGEITVHDAEHLVKSPRRKTIRKSKGPRHTPTAADRDRSGWFAAIADVLGGRSADVVHFVCGGCLTGSETALALAALAPKSGEYARSRYVSVPALTAFLNEIGTWSAAFSSLSGTASDTALRFFADALARRRPGPVLHHEFEQDPNGEQVRDAYRFLYGDVPGDPPRLPASFLYCEPYRVRTPELREVDGLVLQLDPSDALPPSEAVAGLLLADTTPAWVAATERFIEQQLFELADRERGVSSKDGALELDRQGLQAAIAHIRMAVDTNLDVASAQSDQQLES